MTLTHYLKLRARTLTPVEARTLLQPVMEGGGPASQGRADPPRHLPG